MIDGFLNYVWTSGLWFIFVCMVISGLISIIGTFYARNLPKDIVKLYRQKICLVSLVPIMIGFMLSGPYISSWTRLHDQNIKVEILELTDSVKAFEKMQTNQIEDLKLEVTRIRDDLNRMNDLFRYFIQFSMTMGIGMCVAFYHSKNEQIHEIILDGKRGEKTLNL